MKRNIHTHAAITALANDRLRVLSTAFLNVEDIIQSLSDIPPTDTVAYFNEDPVRTMELLSKSILPERCVEIMAMMGDGLESGAVIELELYEELATASVILRLTLEHIGVSEDDIIKTILVTELQQLTIAELEV